MQRLLRLVLGFAVVSMAVLALQYIPFTGFVTGMLGGPYWIGLLLQVLLAAILVMALAGALPRWCLAIPLAIWVQGLVGWQLAIRSAEKAARTDAAKRVAAGALPIVVRGDAPLAMALAAGYRAGEIYSDLHRHRIASGAECMPPERTGPEMSIMTPPALVARAECLVSVRADPPTGALVVEVETSARRETRHGGHAIPVTITKPGAEPVKLAFSVARIPLPIVFPVLGFVYGSRDGARVGLCELWRIERAVPSVASWSGKAFGAPHAGFIARVLELEER